MTKRISPLESVDRPNDIYKFITLLPKDYCLIPGNGAIKLVETQNSLIVNHFQFLVLA